MAVLCRRFAIVNNGRIVAQTTPATARAAIAGTIFEGAADMALFADLRERFCVTQAALNEGINHLRVYNPTGEAPHAGFVAVPPTLEDAYLAVMRGGASLDAPPVRVEAAVDAPPVRVEPAVDTEVVLVEPSVDAPPMRTEPVPVTAMDFHMGFEDASDSLAAEDQ